MNISIMPRRSPSPYLPEAVSYFFNGCHRLITGSWHCLRPWLFITKGSAALPTGPDLMRCKETTQICRRNNHLNITWKQAEAFWETHGFLLSSHLCEPSTFCLTVNNTMFWNIFFIYPSHPLFKHFLSAGDKSRDIRSFWISSFQA